MGDAAGHLSECAQPFVLHDGLLGLAQFLVGGFEFGIEPGLVACQRHVLAEGLEELPFARAEPRWGSACHQEEAPELPLVEQG